MSDPNSWSGSGQRCFRLDPTLDWTLWRSGEKLPSPEAPSWELLLDVQTCSRSRKGFCTGTFLLSLGSRPAMLVLLGPADPKLRQLPTSGKPPDDDFHWFDW